MGSNRLKMNPDKTQFIWLGSRQQLSHINVTPLHLHDGTIIAPSVSIRNLDMIFDSKKTMAKNVNNVIRACFYQLRQLRFMRQCLSKNTVKMLLHAFIASRVYYCNFVLFSTTSGVLRKLQAVLNAAARLFSGLRRFNHITPVLRDELHWLPVKQHIGYKLALLVYKCLHGSVPSYLTEHCTVLMAASLHHQLRSSTRGELHLSRMQTPFSALTASGRQALLS